MVFDPTLYNRRAEEWARQHTDEVLRELGTTSEGQVGEILAGWVAREGATIGELSAELQSAFKDRAGLIAVTEATRAFASGEEAAYKAEGITHWTWKTNADEIRCKWCRDVNGKTVKIGEAFGNDRKGRPVTKPPFHPGCRCWCVPEVNKGRKQAVMNSAPAFITSLSLADDFTELPEKNQQLTDNIKNGINAIDSVLKIRSGRFTKFPIKQSYGKQEIGALSIDITGKPVVMKVSVYSPYPELTTVHEFGHLFDLEGIGTKGKYSSLAGEISQWEIAVENSQAYLNLKRYSKNKTDYEKIGYQRIFVNKDQINYNLQKDELFARSFAQYIALKSGDKILLEQINSVRSGPIVASYFWSEEDFQPIASAFDRLLGKYKR
jgi:SPP1 gp7 family putative phage head morphogenesis protein